jgi:hypothetical protein
MEKIRDKILWRLEEADLARQQLDEEVFILQSIQIIEEDNLGEQTLKVEAESQFN